MFSTDVDYEIVNFSVGDTKAGTKMGKSGLSLPSSPMSNVPARITGMVWRSPDSIILIHLDSAAASLETG